MRVEKFCSRGGEVLLEDLKSRGPTRLRPLPLSLSLSRDSFLDEAGRVGGSLSKDSKLLSG